MLQLGNVVYTSVALCRNVWEQAEKSIPVDKCDSLSINLPLETPVSKRNEHFGSSDSIYHSCWSLNDFPLDKTTDRELAKSRPEVVTSLAGGVKWSSGYDDELSGNQGNRSPWDDPKSGVSVIADSTTHLTPLHLCNKPQIAPKFKNSLRTI